MTVSAELLELLPVLGRMAVFAVIVLGIWAGFFGVGLHRPALIIFPYLAVLVCFTDNLYGSAVAVSGTIYSRGTGQLYFSFMAFAVYVLGIIAMLYRHFVVAPPIRSGLRTPFLLMLALFLGNLLVAPLFDIDITYALSSNGIINLIYMGILFFVLTTFINNRDDLERLKHGLMILIALRGVFALVRWALFGGDPVNVYSNVEDIDVKLTFFDICDNMLAGVGAIYATRMLFSENNTLPTWQRYMYLGFALLEVAVIVLSYRRTAWTGLGLILAYLVWTLPPRQRWWPVLASPFMAMPILAAYAQRLAEATKGRSLVESFFYDLMPKSTITVSHRSLELKYGLHTGLENPLFGAGIWGRYEGAVSIPWQRGPEAYTFVHSGVVHLILKTGLVGTAIAAYAGAACARFLWRARKETPEADRPFFDAAVAGMLFMVPDFFIGTPITQFRTMLLYAFMAAIPFIIAAVNARRETAATP
jgi:hypothetical protein